MILPQGTHTNEHRIDLSWIAAEDSQIKRIFNFYIKLMKYNEMIFSSDDINR